MGSAINEKIYTALPPITCKQVWTDMNNITHQEKELLPLIDNLQRNESLVSSKFQVVLTAIYYGKSDLYNVHCPINVDFTASMNILPVLNSSHHCQ